MYHVYACPRCRQARVVQAGRKTASCGSCGRDLTLADLRPQWSGASHEEARAALGRVNARLAGRVPEHEAALVPPAPRPPKHEDAWDAAAAAGRPGAPSPEGASGAGRARSETGRVDRVARALSEDLGEFHDADLARAMHLAGLPSAKAPGHIARMLTASIVYEPRPGRYRAF